VRPIQPAILIEAPVLQISEEKSWVAEHHKFVAGN